MKKLLGLLLALGMVSTGMSAQFITIGTGGVTGTYYPTGGAVCRLVNKMRKDTGIRCSVESTGGSVYNVNTIRNNELDFGISQSDVVYQAYNGTGKYEGDKFEGLRTVMSIYPELLTLVVSEDSGIKSLMDLKGKKVDVGNPGSGDEAGVSILFGEAGITRDDLALASTLKASERPNALKDRKIDAYFYFVGHPTANVKDAANSLDIDIVNLNGPVVENILDQYPYYAMGTIPAETYNGVDHEVESFGVKAVLVTSTEVGDKAVYAVTKAILDNFEDFKKLHPAYKGITKESLLQGLAAPLHPGAEQYYKEHGLID